MRPNKTLFQRRYQDTHNCHLLFTCPSKGASKVFIKGADEMEQLLEDKDIAPALQRAIIGSMKGARSGTHPHPSTYGRAQFGCGLSLQSIVSDQVDIRWINFLSGRWSVKWKEPQKRHYFNMNKKKSARAWAMVILKKLMMIRWDLWQYRNNIKYSLTGPTAIASHHSLNYRISEEKVRGTDGISKSNSYLFSTYYSITKLQSGDIPSKLNWLEIVCLARADYEEPDSAIICQAIFQRNQIQEYLLTNGPLVSVPARRRPIAIQDNRISEEAQQAATAKFFGTTLIPAPNLPGSEIGAVLG